MWVRIKIGDLLWKVAGQLETRLELDEGATATDALTGLYQACPALAAELLPGGKTRNGLPYHFFVNRRIVAEADMASRLLKDGDTLYILSPTAGG